MKIIMRASLMLVVLMAAANAQAGYGRCGTVPQGRAISYGPHHYAPPPSRYRCPPPPTCAPSGYWTMREQRVWVPGRWVSQCSPYTTSQRVWQSAHYETRWVQVWVSTRS